MLLPTVLFSCISSIDRVAIVDNENGISALAADLLTANSPSECAIRVKPVGAHIKGNGVAVPSIFAELSIFDTSRSTLGLNL